MIKDEQMTNESAFSREAGAVALRQAIVLIAEDDDDIRTELVELVESAGHRVLACGDGSAVLEVLAQVRPDAILLDLKLPTVSGWEVLAARQSDAALAAIPVIAVTGYAATAPPDVTCVISKPFDSDELVSVLTRALTTSGFILRSPEKPEASAPSTPPASSPVPKAERNFRHAVLVIDDDSQIRDTLTELLEQEGYVVAVFAAAKDALEHLRRSPAPGLILLDLAMPVMTGFAFRAQQRADPMLADIPVVVMTAGVYSRDKRAELAASDYLMKPFRLGRLLEVVARYCR